MHRILAFILTVTLTGAPAVHASGMESHGASQHESGEAATAAEHHSDNLACGADGVGCQDADTSSIDQCCPALSGHCSVSSASIGGTGFIALPFRALAASMVEPDRMSGLRIQPEPPPPRS